MNPPSILRLQFSPCRNPEQLTAANLDRKMRFLNHFWCEWLNPGTISQVPDGKELIRKTPAQADFSNQFALAFLANPRAK
jgi:hypothetical protein